MVESDGSDDDDDQVKKLLIKHAQKEAAASCFLLITDSLVNSNRKVFSDTNPAAESAISP